MLGRKQWAYIPWMSRSRSWSMPVPNNISEAAKPEKSKQGLKSCVSKDYWSHGWSRIPLCFSGSFCVMWEALGRLWTEEWHVLTPSLKASFCLLGWGLRVKGVQGKGGWVTGLLQYSKRMAQMTSLTVVTGMAGGYGRMRRWFLFIYLQCWGSNSGPHASKASTLTPSCAPKPSGFNSVGSLWDFLVSSVLSIREKQSLPFAKLKKKMCVCEKIMVNKVLDVYINSTINL